MPNMPETTSHLKSILSQSLKNLQNLIHHGHHHLRQKAYSPVWPGQVLAMITFCSWPAVLELGGLMVTQFKHVLYTFAKHLARRLHLSRKQQFVQVDGIGGITDKFSRWVVQFNACPSNFGRKNIHVEVEAVVLPKVILNLPVHTVSYDHSWTHLL